MLNITRRAGSSLITGLLCVALLLTQSGCFTLMIWDTAAESRVHCDKVSAVAPEAGKVDAPPPLRVRYSLSHWMMFTGDPDSFEMIIPADAAGRPVWPFWVESKVVTMQDVVAAVPHAQMEAIQNWQFSKADRRAAKRLKDRPEIPRPAGVSTVYIYTLHCRAFAVDDGGEIVPLLEHDDDDVNAAVFPPGSRVVLIPDSQPRPAASHRLAVAEAAVLTPFTLVIDTAVTSLAIVFLMIGPRC